jgi:hypothetical protein
MNLDAYWAALETRKIADGAISTAGSGRGAASTIRRGTVDERGSRAATTVMLMIAPTPLDADEVVCDANWTGASGFPALYRAGRMTDAAMVITARATPASPSATRGTDDTYVL